MIQGLYDSDIMNVFSEKHLNAEVMPIKDKKRDYVCPCGKRYFSNPALYIHVKRKHNGEVLSFNDYRRLLVN